MHIFGGSVDGSQPLPLLSNLSHAFGQLHVLLLLTGLCSLMSVTSCASSRGIPESCPFGPDTEPHWLLVVEMCSPSVLPMSVTVCNVAGSMGES